MLNPFGPQQEPGLSSYASLQKRTLQNIKAANVDDRIFQVVQNAFEEALRHEHMVLSRPERMKLFSQVLRAVLQEMLEKLDNSTKRGS